LGVALGAVGIALADGVGSAAAGLICNGVPHFGQVIFLPATDSLERRFAPHGQRNWTDIREVLRKGFFKNFMNQIAGSLILIELVEKTKTEPRMDTDQR
jgi:hypothetical protein